MRSVLLLTAALLALAAPAQAESVPTALYAHVINIQDMPINTQEPAAAYEDSGRYGPFMMTLTCLRDEAPVGGLTSLPFSTARGYSSAALVEYGQAGEGGEPRTHPERGIAGDVRLDPAVRPVLVWYLATAMDASAEGASASAPAVVPQMQLRAMVRAGDAISIDDAAYDDGELLMQGTSPPATLVADRVVAGPDGADGVTALGQRGGLWVYEVRVPLDVAAGVIPRATGFNLRVDAYTSSPACDPDDGLLLPASVGGYTGPGARPRIELAALDPLTVEYAHSEWAGDDLVVLFGLRSAWGKYDLDLANLTFEVDGPGQHAFHPAPPPESHLHGSLRTPEAQVPFVWERAAREAPPGHYDVTVTVQDRQHTATLVATAAFDVEPRQDAPAPAAPLLGLGLVAAAGLLRRRAP